MVEKRKFATAAERMYWIRFSVTIYEFIDLVYGPEFATAAYGRI